MEVGGGGWGTIPGGVLGVGKVTSLSFLKLGVGHLVIIQFDIIIRKLGHTNLFTNILV